MEARYVGVDVSKDRLDVHVLPDGAAFAVARDGKGLADLVERLSALQPERIAVEATSRRSWRRRSPALRCRW
jgi:transposase